MRSSPVVRSPLTVNTSFERRATSPRNFTSSPSPRLTSESPVRTLLNTSTTSTSNAASKLNSETYRVTQHTYRSSINQNASPVPPFKHSITDGVDYSSNISPIKPGSGRRDSWDVLNKTKHMFSNNSLESLAKLTEEQLDTNLSFDRSAVDNVTQTNTQFNKFSLSDSSFKERNEKFVSRTNTNDYGYTSSASKFMPIGDDVEGARAIKVSNKPDGFLGQPFEFESEDDHEMMTMSLKNGLNKISNLSS
jgi:filamin